MYKSLNGFYAIFLKLEISFMILWTADTTEKNKWVFGDELNFHGIK